VYQKCPLPTEDPPHTKNREGKINESEKKQGKKENK
jgi:hypothetical protein